jgi:WD40 repeat protein
MSIYRTNWFFVMGLLLFTGGVYAQGFSGANISNQISRTISGNIAKSLFDRMLMPQLKIRNESGEVKDFFVSTDSRFFTLLHEDNTVRIWDAKQGIQRPIIVANGLTITKVASISTLDIALLATDHGDIVVYDIYTGKRVSQLNSGHPTIVSLSVSNDESVLAVAHENGVVAIWDLRKMSLINSIQTPYEDDLKFVSMESKGQTFIVAGEDGFVDRWRIDEAEKTVSLAKHEDDIAGLWVSKRNGSVASFDEDNVFQRSDANNTRPVKKALSFDPLAITVSEDLKLVAIATESDGIKIFDAGSMQQLKQIASAQPMYYLQFINKGTVLITADEKGVLHVFSIDNAQEIMKLISTKTGWTVVDAKGRFDSSEKGMVNVSWEVAEDYEIPLDNFSASHYEPGLLASHLEDQDFINKKPLVVQQGIRLPPQVKIIIPDGNRTAAVPLLIRVEAQGSTVEEIKLYHNGKVMSPDTVMSSQQEIIDKLVKKTVEFKVFPGVGKNTFKVIATNKMNIEGHSDELIIEFKGEEKQRTLHVLTIGINKYKDARLNLDYSVADAAEIASKFNKTELSAFDQIIQHELRDEDATRTAIFQQLNNMSHYLQNDVIIIYLAGHGLAVEGEWYFMPHETMIKDNQQYYAEVGISAQRVQEILIASKVQHVMIMIDACYSGASLKSFRKMQDIQRRFSRGLSKSVGVVVLAATRKDQQAAELTDLGHGLFTYVVSEGLKGKADLKPINQQISAHEVADFSTETIPAFSRKYLGASQEPTKFTMGSDFTLLTKE